MMLLALLGCNENELNRLQYDAIAVVLGDFDNTGDLLTASTVGWTAYDGFIVQAVYEPEDDRMERGEMAYTVEGLLTDTTGSLDLDSYNAVFVNSGTRGLGYVQYNDQLEPDNGLLADAKNLEKTCAFVERGGTLVASDWAYDLVQFCWPEAVTFYGDSTRPDAAQVGVPSTSVIAEVKDESLVADLGTSITLVYDYTAWAVMTDVGPDTEVLLQGNVEYQPDASKLYEQLNGVPLLVRFPVNRGQVVFSTFHWGAQPQDIAERLLLGAVEGLNPGDGSESADAAQGEDTGA